ncbi:MAG: PD-(D/E)XK nuclease family protein [Pisciglobus halotolerans]|nr:PD-(D/E)XK nuclease family protein [Pisciglobus halotolerans]
MLVRKHLIQYEEELTLFRGEVQKDGFIQKLTELFVELRNGRVREDDLYQTIQSLGNSTQEADFKLKLKDITLLYDAFETALIGKFIESEDILMALTKKIYQLDLSETIVYIDNFIQFTAQEQDLILALMKQVKKLTISLTLDTPYIEERPELHELFQLTGETYYKLYHLARQNQVKIYLDHNPTEKNPDYCEALNKLEDYWVESSKLSPVSAFKDKTANIDECIHVWAAENKQAEVTHVANEIHHLVANGKYRYKDILVLARDPNEYLTLLEPIFNRNAIPTFIDSFEVMANHPFSELLDALFLIKKHNWRYNDIFRLLRTELLIPKVAIDLPKERNERVHVMQSAAAKFREKVDTTENVALAYGYEGFHWTKKEPWHYTKFQYEGTFQSDTDLKIEETANEVRDYLKEILVPFFNRLDKTDNGSEAAKILYQFLERNGVSEQLLFWRDRQIQQGNLENARRQEQIWQVFITLLDEFVEVLGEETVEEESFQAIIRAGFENASYSIVPPSIDQVIYSSLASIRAGTSKITFLLGLTDKKMPAAFENDSMLTEEDRAILDNSLEDDKYVKASLESQMASEPFIAYQAFLDSSDQLYLSYPTSSDSKEGTKLSSYVQRIADHFELDIEQKAADIVSLSNPTKKDFLSFIGSKQQTIGQLLMVLRKEQDKKGVLHPVWKALFRYFKKDTETSKLFYRLLDSLTRKNIPKPLKKEIAEKLYGKDLYLSVSQLESFYQDPYTHFLQYGLKLQERKVYELSAAGTGEYFHEALDLLFKELINRDLSLDQIDQETIDELTDRLLEELKQKQSYSVLTTSNRMDFIREQLERTVKQMAWALKKQSQRSNMRNSQTEVLFGRIGQASGVDGLDYSLPSGGHLYVRGKIDRIDQMTVKDKHYLNVIDYKSSAHSFSYRDAYYGLTMQMLTYLDIALRHAKELTGHESLPAGAFYIHVQNPFVKAAALSDEDAYYKELLKLYKMKGLLLNDPEMLMALDKTIEPTQQSLVYPFNQKKDGETKSNHFVTLNEMQLLRTHNQKLIVDAGDRILTGETKLHPVYEKRQFIPSVNGPLRAVSLFDAMLPENNYLRLEKLKDKDFIEKMKDEEMRPEK